MSYLDRGHTCRWIAGLVPEAGIVGKARPINEKAELDQEFSTPRVIPKKTEQAFHVDFEAVNRAACRVLLLISTNFVDFL